MTKIYTLLLALLIAWPTFAKSESNGLSKEEMEKTFEILKNVEGYVFLEKGADKTRALSETFSRPDSVKATAEDFKKLDWDVYIGNDGQNNIVKIDEEGNITGLNYGETIITLTDKDETVHYYIVFVCPTVTIVSPDGVIYTHQKIYNSKMQVTFTHSKNYNINCVMAEDGDELHDVTDKIDPESVYYSSDDYIKGDVRYTVTLEECDEDYFVTGKSPIRLQVSSSNLVTIDLQNTKVDGNIEIEVTSFDGNTNNSLSLDEPEFELKDEGIYFVTVKYNNQTDKFKVIIKH